MQSRARLSYMELVIQMAALFWLGNEKFGSLMVAVKKSWLTRGKSVSVNAGRGGATGQERDA